MNPAAQQSRYQVRFAWGAQGAADIAPGAHVVVWTDALPGPAGDPRLLAVDAAVLGATAACRAAAADWVLARQVERGDRAIVAVVAAGGPSGEFAVEDLVAAGAVIDALVDVGIDFISPEAAAAAGAFAALRNAGSHVLTASVAGQQLLAAEGAEALEVARAAAMSAELTVLRP